MGYEIEFTPFSSCYLIFFSYCLVQGYGRDAASSFCLRQWRAFLINHGTLSEPSYDLKVCPRTVFQMFTIN